MVRAIADRSWISGAKNAPFWLDGRDEPDVLVTPKGIMYVHGMTLGPHDPALFNLAATDFDFDPSAVCPRFDAWLDWFCCGDKSLATFLLQFLGYILLPSLQFQHYLVLLGNGNNGKQVLLRLIEKLVGGNVSAIPLERMGDRFAMASVVGKAVNLCADIDDHENRSKGKLPEGALKAATDGSMIAVEDKFKPIGYTVLQTKFILCANRMPWYSCQSEGTWRRPIIFPCDAVVTDELKIPGFEKTLFGEMPGILNRVLAAARHLVTLPDFEIPERCKAINNQFRLEQNSAKEFCTTHVALGKEKDFAPEMELFKEYVRWCECRRGSPVGFPRFFHTFGDVWKKQKDSHAIYYTKRGRRGNRVTGWAGIRIVDPADEGDEEEAVVVPVVSQPVKPKPVKPSQNTALAVVARIPVIDRLRDAFAVVEESDVNRLLDELLEEDGAAVPIQQLPLAVEGDLLRAHEAEAVAINAGKKVVELKLKLRKAERKAKELTEKAELQRKKAVSGSTVTVPDSRPDGSLPAVPGPAQSPMSDELNT